MKKKTLIFAALAMVFATAPDCTVKLHAETMQTEEQDRRSFRAAD